MSRSDLSLDGGNLRVATCDSYDRLLRSSDIWSKVQERRRRRMAAERDAAAAQQEANQ
jgi:hypothetical protein